MLSKVDDIMKVLLFVLLDVYDDAEELLFLRGSGFGGAKAVQEFTRLIWVQRVRWVARGLRKEVTETIEHN